MCEPDMAAMVDTLPMMSQRSTFGRFTPLERRNSETGSVGNSPVSDTGPAAPPFTLESLAAELELLSPGGGFSYLSGDLYNAQYTRGTPLTKSRSVPNVIYTQEKSRANSLAPLRKTKSVRFADSQGLPLIEAVHELTKQDPSYTANKIVPYSDDLASGVCLVTGRYQAPISRENSKSDSSKTTLTELHINTRPTILKTSQSSPILKRQSSPANSPPAQPATTHRHRLGFTQPSLEPDFFQRVNRQCVVLDNVREESRSLQGTVRVANLSYEKQVMIRWTHDNWRSSHDTKAVFCACDGTTDRFTFELPINGDDVIFCIRYRCSGGEYWDNNRGNNYTVFSE